MLKGKFGGEGAARVPVLSRGSGDGDAEFIGAEFVDGYAVLRWETPHGGVGLAHSLTSGNGQPEVVVSRLFDRHWPRMRVTYACVVVAQAASRVSEPEVPELLALDILDGKGAKSPQYRPTWQELAEVLGTRPPYWFSALRDREVIAAWRPSAPPALVPACHVENPVTALAELAAAEPEDSPAARTCLALAREIRSRDHHSVASGIEELQENASEGGDGSHLVLGAIPDPPRRKDEDVVPEVVRRAGWLAITERRDVIAHRVARLGQRWDGGEDWHTGAPVSAQPEGCSTAAEWARRLVPAPRDQAPTVLEQYVLDESRDPGGDELLHDPVTGIPALRRAQRRAWGGGGDIFTLALQRLPTTSPLASMTVSGTTSWVRTEDGTLWFAPERAGYGVSWGYGGGGTDTLARLLDRLLDDISAAAIRPGDRDAPKGLFNLLRHTPRDESTTYTRSQLLAARDA